MLKITCPDGVDLKFMEESTEYTVEDGKLEVKNSATKEVLIRLDEGKWSNIVAMSGENTVTL